MRGGPDDERVSIFEGALNGREERQQKENGAQNIFFFVVVGLGVNDTVNTEMVAFDSPSHLFKMEMRKRCTEDEQEKKKRKKRKRKKKRSYKVKSDNVKRVWVFTL